MRQDLISDVMYVMNNAENMGKGTCTVPASKLIKDVLMVMQKAGYVGSFEFIDDSRSGFFQIQLAGHINSARAIKPRFAVKKNEYEKWEERYLPAINFGILVVSTPKGIMSQKDASKQGLGGRLICYVY